MIDVVPIKYNRRYRKAVDLFSERLEFSNDTMLFIEEWLYH